MYLDTSRSSQPPRLAHRGLFSGTGPASRPSRLSRPPVSPTGKTRKRSSSFPSPTQTFFRVATRFETGTSAGTRCPTQVRCRALGPEKLSTPSLRKSREATGYGKGRTTRRALRQDRAGLGSACLPVHELSSSQTIRSSTTWGDFVLLSLKACVSRWTNQKGIGTRRTRPWRNTIGADLWAQRPRCRDLIRAAPTRTSRHP
mmetsp:Transcript_746/g.2843  ORF Transcript_746/g.2843 Transcript_746/m.2843 type:complete len:201 (-) Transcript_746:536-1138(-)